MNEKKMDARLTLGFIFGVIVIIAVVIEMYLGGFSTNVIVRGVKDVAGTAVSVLVFVVAWMSIQREKHCKFDFDKVLEKRLDQWRKERDNMISLHDGNLYDLMMKTDISNYFGGGQDKAGRFVKITCEDKTKLLFSLNKSLFVGVGVDDGIAQQKLASIGITIRSYAQRLFDGYAHIRLDDSENNIEFTMKSNGKTREDVDKIMEIVDTMYRTFLVCATYSNY